MYNYYCKRKQTKTHKKAIKCWGAKCTNPWTQKDTNVLKHFHRFLNNFCKKEKKHFRQEFVDMVNYLQPYNPQIIPSNCG